MQPWNQPTSTNQHHNRFYYHGATQFCSYLHIHEADVQIGALRKILGVGAAQNARR